VADRPLRVPDAEALLEGEALRASTVAEVARRYAEAAEPVADERGSVDYKRHTTAVYVRRAIAAAARRAGLEVNGA
jgi:carbon-monoxide dehydrogenase medium subunit